MKEKKSSKDSNNTGTGSSYTKFRGGFHSGGTQAGGNDGKNVDKNGDKNDGKNTDKDRCIFGCSKPHKKPSNCPKLSNSLNEKTIVEIIQKEKACFHCFGKTCDWRKCKENAPICPICNQGKHNPHLCREAEKARTGGGAANNDKNPTSGTPKKDKK